MTNAENTGNAQEKPQEPKQDISSLKAKLNELNSKKEEWFNKKEELNKKISELVNVLKNANPEVISRKSKEAELKKKRDECNKKFREHLEQSKGLVKGRENLREKFGKGANPHSLKERLEKLEYSIETEVLSIEREKSLMRQIKEIRKNLEENEDTGDFKSQMGEISQNLNEAKEQADKYHQELKELVNKNKKEFKEYIINSKKVNELKKEQRQAFKKFIEFKTEFSKLNSQLKVLLKESGELPPKRKKQPRKRRDKTQDIKKIQESFVDSAKIIEEKVKEVEDKIKKKKKLTTKDLIAMQGAD